MKEQRKISEKPEEGEGGDIHPSLLYVRGLNKSKFKDFTVASP